MDEAILDPCMTYKNFDWLYLQRITLKRKVFDIAIECGVHKRTIENYLKEFHIKFWEADKTYANKDWLGYQINVLGKSQVQVAQECNVDRLTVCRWYNFLFEDLIKEAKKKANNTYKNHDWLYLQYITLQKTFMQIAKECGVSRSVIIKNLNKNNIKGTKEKIRFSHSGIKNPRWLGGISYEPYCPKFDKDLRRRVRAYFDNQCVLCGKSSQQNKKNLSVHHVSYNKNACCDGKRVQFAALCQSCHSKTGAKRENWEEMLHIIIYEIYNDRSYFTKEEWKDIYI